MLQEFNLGSNLLDDGFDAFLMARALTDEQNKIYDFEIINVSRNAETLLKRSKSQMIGQLLCDVFPATKVRGLLAHYIETLSTELPFETSFQTTTTLIQGNWVRVRCTPHGQNIVLVVHSISSMVLESLSKSASEARFQAAFANAAIGVAILTLDGHWLEANEALTTMLGYSLEELRHKTFLEITHPDDLVEDLMLTKRLLDGEIENFNIHKRYIHKNNEMIWAKLYVALIRTSDGVPINFITHIEDITERKQIRDALEASERLYRLITENAHDMIVVASSDGRFTFASPSTKSVLGYDSTEVMQLSIQDFLHPEDLERVLSDQAKALESGANHFRSEFRIRHKDGREIWFENIGHLIRDPQTNALVQIQNTARDITERVHAQKALKVLNAQLERRVLERTQRLGEVNAELESFTSSVSHDLRSPLNAVQGFARALLEDYGETLPTTGRDFVSRIIGASKRMDTLINDLLSYSRLSRTEIRLVPVNLERLLDEVIFELEADIQKANASLKLEGQFPTVLAQGTVLRQILTNLIGNALKFVAQPNLPNIKIWTEQHEQNLRLIVEDNGIGMDAKNLERIFKPFERLHGVSEYPGSGIGLAFVKRGIERIGGRVGVKSTPSRGSQFWLELPQIVGEL
jgi:PAS domain S-box-containing protein